MALIETSAGTSYTIVDAGAASSYANDTETPQTTINWLHLDNGSYSEHGAGVDNLHVKAFSGDNFTSTTKRLAPNGARVDAGQVLFHGGMLSLKTNYDGDFRAGYIDHCGKIQLNIAF